MKAILTTTKDYKKLWLNDSPLLDVRAPIEFEKGAFPMARNCPITNDDERHLIGTHFKKYGRVSAIKFGNKLVSGHIKEERLAAWKKFIDENPNGALYCYRGGLRSHIAQQWIYEAFGIDYPLVEGGYKALRNFLIEALESVGDWIDPIRIGGRTGVGKTKCLLKLKNHIDLEGIANHRGSSFGKKVFPQPAQIDFENHLAVELIKQKDKVNCEAREGALGQSGKFKTILEDEGRQIGRVSIPNKTYAAFRNGPLVVLDIPVDERVELTFDEYITQALSDYQAEHDEEKGFRLWRKNIETSLQNIERRLGGARYQALAKEVQAAMSEQEKTGNADWHKPWIKTLLVDYYDPMYDYHIAKVDNEIIFQGDESEVIDFLKKVLKKTKKQVESKKTKINNECKSENTFARGGRSTKNQ